MSWAFDMRQYRAPDEHDGCRRLGKLCVRYGEPKICRPADNERDYKPISYAYDYNGATSTLTYPDSRIVTYTYNNVAQELSAVDTANSINYATGGTYAPPGGLSALTLGQTGTFTGINVSNTYNKRLQPTELKAWSTAGTAFDLTYCFTSWVSGVCQTTGGNNGNVNGITNNLHSTRTQAFTYDQLNRIATATASAWSLNVWA